MTLKDYTLFVTKFSLFSAMKFFDKETAAQLYRTLIIIDLAALLGFEKWEKFLDLLRVKLLHKGDESDELITKAVGNKWFFLELLVEFCEPLIERTAEKPERGQDAAKV